MVYKLHTSLSKINQKLKVESEQIGILQRRSEQIEITVKQQFSSAGYDLDDVICCLS